MYPARGTLAVVPGVLILPAGTSADPGAGATAELKFAAAFVDQKDQDKPVVLVISDQKLRVEKPSYFLILNSAFPSLRSNKLSLREFAAENVKCLDATPFFP